jgi:hypothetical protein
MGGVGYGVVLTGSHAYVADGSGGLRVVDVTDPAEPLEVGYYTTTGTARDVAVSGQYAYVADGDGGLRVIDVGTPTQPVEIGAYDALTFSTSVFISDSVVYLIDDSKVLYTFDVSDPSQPQKLGSFGIPNAIRVVVAGEYAYVACGSRGLRVIDVSDPLHPSEVRHADSMSALDVNVVSDTAYVVGGYSAMGLHVLDVADPLSPTVVGYYELSYARQLEVAGDRVYVILDCAVVVVDVTDPALPAWENRHLICSVGALAVEGEHLYVARTGGYGFTVVQMIPTKDPVVVGSLETPVIPRGVAYGGGKLYAGNWGQGLSVLDVGDPTQPSVVGLTDTLETRGDVALANGYAYVSHWSSDWQIMTVSNPADLDVISSFDGEHVAVAGGFAYASTFDEFRVVDLALPATPTVTGTIYYFRLGANDIVAAGNHAYVLTDDELIVVEVATPTQPVERSSVAVPCGTGLTVSDGYAYVLCGGSLSVFDVTDPGAPVQTGFTYMQGGSNLTVVGNHAFVASWTKGLQIVDVTDPSRPSVVATYNTPGIAFDLVLDGDLVYLADEGGGIHVLRFSPCTTATIPISGGTLTSTTDSTTYRFTSGDFTDTVIITHTYLSPVSCPASGHLVGIDHCYEVTAVYSNSGSPAYLDPGQTYTLTIQYADAELGVAIEDTLALHHWGGGQWTSEAAVVDLESNTITATLDHFSIWAVLGEVHRMYLPLMGRSTQFIDIIGE